MSCSPLSATSGCGACEGAGPRPHPLVMGLRFLAFGAGVAAGLAGLLRNRRWRELAAWTGGWALFLSIPRYLICAGCSGYGQMCYSYYLGKYTSFIFPRREKEVPAVGLVLEVISLSLIFWMPALGMRSDRKGLLRYLALMQLVLAGQFFHSCRYCAAHSQDSFKSVCPAYRFWSSFGGGR